MSTNTDEPPFTVTVQRDRFRFDMLITKSVDNAFESYTFEVGDTKPCLKLYVRVPKTDDERYVKACTIATLLNIEALIECSLNDINENYVRKHGFGTEILATVEHIVKTYFPHVKHISLNDTSYMPCNRALDDTLDMLTYSIALYGKTWYEIKVHAYLSDPIKQTKYDEEVAKYMSPKFKKSFDADAFLIEKMKLSSNLYIQNELKTRYDEIKSLFTQSETFPQFFKSLRDSIPEKQKCKFFKDWLQSFISENITIHRTWQYDVPSVSNYKHIPSGCAELETEGNAVVVQCKHTLKGCAYNWHSTVYPTKIALNALHNKTRKRNRKKQNKTYRKQRAL